MIIQQITYYLQGRLTEAESKKLWENLVMNEADLEIMEIYWMLRQFFTEELKYAPNTQDPSNCSLKYPI